MMSRKAAAVVSAELFGTRTFSNGRQLGALLGLVPVPSRSDQAVRDQGISKAGRAELRRMWLQIVWGWLRWQPHRALTQWFQRRFGAAGGRSKFIGVADGPERTQLPRDRCHSISARGHLLVTGSREPRQARLDCVEMRSLVCDATARRHREWPTVPGVRRRELLDEPASQLQPQTLRRQHPLDAIAHPRAILAYRLDLS